MTADEIHDENLKEFADAMGVCADAITVKRVEFTPGPWGLNSVFGPSTGVLSVTHPMWRNNSHPIARVYRRLMDERRDDGTHQFHDAEAQANANLIAAAPDLYVACMRLLASYGDDMGDDGVDWEDLDNAVQAAREAVAKADGVPAS